MARRSLKDSTTGSGLIAPELEKFVFGGNEASAKVLQEAEVTTLPREKIHLTFSFTPNRRPLRYHYDHEVIRQWAETELKPNGIRNPLWVRPHPDVPNEYELVAGCRRYYGSAFTGEDPPVRIFEWDDAIAYRAAIAENAHREDFNALEETDYILNLLALAINSTREAAASLLYQFNNTNKRKGNQDVLAHPEFPQVQSVFEYVGNITWQSFVSARLPLLKKPEDVLTAIRTGEIDYCKGLEIAKITDESERRNLLDSAIADKLSVSAIKKRVKVLKQPAIAKPEGTPIDRRTRWVKVQSKISKSKVWDNPKNAKQLDKVLTQLEKLLGEKDV